ncbi:Hypothetical Protein FCC1311_045032 [Hondaea fermentalgiana]|uniref:Uncharacterized protein n=1 Tax=Hondaea fermentalgiana TaxID=2315210 RepID=A0A2R5GBB5_9STRA|nr:Hypothetical Protein FCC1311_045032 [Hondaea fermentalgiana]|eukprot:GBG28280.1 Hypothetical Protein FCC1311_045032 [Hondaea fermentalgiana]
MTNKIATVATASNAGPASTVQTAAGLGSSGFGSAGKWPSARSLLNVDALDAVLRELAAQRETQETALGNLERGFQAKASALDVKHIESRLEAWAAKLGNDLKSVRQRIDIVDRGDVQDTDASSQRLGRVVAWQLRRLEQIDAALARKATQERCDAVYERLHEMYVSLNRSMQTEHAKIRDVDTLRDAHAELSRQVTLVQQLLAGKLDKSTFAHLDALAQRVRSFTDSHDALLDRAQNAEDRLARSESALEKQAAQIRKLNAALCTMQKRLDASARAADQDLLAARLVEMQERVEESAAAKDVVRIDSSLARTRDRVDQLAASVESAIKPLQTKLATDQRSLAERAEAAAVQERKTIQALHKDIAHIKERLQTRASQTDLASLLEWSQDAKAQHGSLEKRMDFALRFIDWYSKSSSLASPPSFASQTSAARPPMSVLSKR